MKKIVVFALIAIMALSFTGCSKGGADYMPYGLSFGDSIPECVSKNKNFPDVNPDDGGYVSEYESISNKFFSEHFGVDENIENHNLIRAKAQLELLRQMEEKEEEMKGVIEKYGF